MNSNTRKRLYVDTDGVKIIYKTSRILFSEEERSDVHTSVDGDSKPEKELEIEQTVEGIVIWLDPRKARLLNCQY